MTIEGLELDERELTGADSALLASARAMTGHAYAPYSEFRVGAAVRMAGGAVVKGANQENAAYPSGLCAERVAVFAAASQYPGEAVEAVAIAVSSTLTDTSGPVTPCGSCRQALMEYRHLQGAPIRVILGGQGSKVWVFEDVAVLLPFAFQAEGLKKG